MKCPYCNHEFEVQEELDEHVRLFHSEKYREWETKNLMDAFLEKMAKFTSGYISRQEIYPSPIQFALTMTELALKCNKSPQEVKKIYDETFELYFGEGEGGKDDKSC